ncbi:acyl carrier protein [Aliikangiella sp. IMCC44359]|uniref:acyl carrier protein n=1 Tax=Aliikangiella sp. IMCC44359 TaxID=3459125 RepID=UPI00403AC125
MSEAIKISDLKEMLSDIFDMEPDEIKDSSHFVDDLGVDSLVALQLIVKVERKYGLKLDEEFMSQMTTLANVHKLLNEKLSETA